MALTFAPALAALIAIVSVLIAILNTSEAHTKKVEAEEVLATATNALSQAMAVVNEMQSLKEKAEFTAAVLEALNDSRYAFTNLQSIALSKTNHFSMQADAEMRRILSRVGTPFLGGLPTNVDLQTITYDEAYRRYKTAPESENFLWVGVVASAYNNSNDRGFTFEHEMDFFAEVIRDTPSLQAELYAEYLFRLCLETNAPAKWPLFSPTSYEGWWSSNKVPLLAKRQKIAEDRAAFDKTNVVPIPSAGGIPMPTLPHQ